MAERKYTLAELVFANIVLFIIIVIVAYAITSRYNLKIVGEEQNHCHETLFVKENYFWDEDDAWNFWDWNINHRLYFISYYDYEGERIDIDRAITATGLYNVVMEEGDLWGHIITTEYTEIVCY